MCMCVCVCARTRTQVQIRSLLIQPGLLEQSFHAVERRTRNDVDIDFTTDGLVPHFSLFFLLLFLFFSRDRVVSLFHCGRGERGNGKKRLLSRD